MFTRSAVFRHCYLRAEPFAEWKWKECNQNTRDIPRVNYETWLNSNRQNKKPQKFWFTREILQQKDPIVGYGWDLFLATLINPCLFMCKWQKRNIKWAQRSLRYFWKKQSSLIQKGATNQNMVIPRFLPPPLKIGVFLTTDASGFPPAPGQPARKTSQINCHQAVIWSSRGPFSVENHGEAVFVCSWTATAVFPISPLLFPTQIIWADVHSTWGRADKQSLLQT